MNDLYGFDTKGKDIDARFGRYEQWKEQVEMKYPVKYTLITEIGDEVVYEGVFKSQEALQEEGLRKSDHAEEAEYNRLTDLALEQEYE